MMLALLALLALVAGAEPPAAPERDPPAAPVAGECTRSWDLNPGAELPAGLVVDGRLTCDAVAVPTSDLYEARALEGYAAELESYARALELELRAVTHERDAARLEADRWREVALRPLPLLARPGVGVVAGVGVCALSGWAVGQAGR